MNILVIGCGLLGRKIARTMDAFGWDVSALSSSGEELELLETDFGGVLFRGFPMDLRSLREAGIESCHAVAVTTDDDNLNIAVAQIARDYFGIENVVACISEPEREAAFENLGLRTVCPTNLAGDTLVRALLGEKSEAQISFGMHRVEFVVRPADRYQVGRTLSELRGYPNEVLFGIIRKNGALLLNTIDEARPENGDSIIFAKAVD
ncbi:MAG: TrkA family potassium uptake protein [Clostridia bacterium]|nr:TrkA family potassium uptake protein [Clostridia bacterium]